MENHDHVARAIKMFCTDPEFEAARLSDTHPIHRATIYVSPKLTIKVTRRTKLDRREKHKQEFVVTIGQPNWHERQRIKQFLKVDEPFPVKRPQVQYDPPKRKR